MKDYLLKFRGQAFDGSMALFKRTLIPNFILNIIMGIISLAILVPLALKAFGWSLSDLMNIQEKFREMSQTISTGGDPMEIVRNMFGMLDPLYFILCIIMALLINCWMLYGFLKLNDNEVRSNDKSFISALSKSLSGRIFTILGFSILYSLLFSVIIIAFMFLVTMLAGASKVMGILIGFAGFFVVIIFLMRFSLGLPAIVHGNMGIIQAFTFSYKNITWKRAGLIFLFGLILVILLIILSGLLSLITNPIIGTNNAGSIPVLITQQILSSISGAIFGTFIYASMTTLYFRYSSDMIEETDIKDHLVEG